MTMTSPSRAYTGLSVSDLLLLVKTVFGLVQMPRLLCLLSLSHHVPGSVAEYAARIRDAICHARALDVQMEKSAVPNRASHGRGEIDCGGQLLA
jgi:hypothetical protein